MEIATGLIRFIKMTPSTDHTRLRDIGATGVRVLSSHSGKAAIPRPAEYRTSATPLGLLSPMMDSRTDRISLSPPFRRVMCTLSSLRVLNVWSVSSLAARHGHYPLTESVSARYNKSLLTALNSRSVKDLLAN